MTTTDRPRQGTEVKVEFKVGWSLFCAAMAGVFLAIAITTDVSEEPIYLIIRSATASLFVAASLCGIFQAIVDYWIEKNER